MSQNTEIRELVKKKKKILVRMTEIFLFWLLKKDFIFNLSEIAFSIKQKTELNIPINLYFNKSIKCHKQNFFIININF